MKKKPIIFWFLKPCIDEHLANKKENNLFKSAQAFLESLAPFCLYITLTFELSSH